jgi:hypothetical protein
VVRDESGKHGITRVIDKAQSAALIPAVKELLATPKKKVLDREPETISPHKRDIDRAAS